jgi:hypothetical protein
MPSYIDTIMRRILEENSPHKRGPVPKVNPEPPRAMDEVEWELVRADIAALKAEHEANGDMTKWRKDQHIIAKLQNMSDFS